MTMYLEEFLIRGRPPGSNQAMTYHVILGSLTQDTFGKPQLALSDAMTPEQATAAGYPLPAIVAELNAGLIDENTKLKADLAAVTAARDAYSEEVERLTSPVNPAT